MKKQVTCLGESTENYITFTVPKKKKLQELTEMKKKLLKINVTYYSLLKDLWQFYYQILSTIFLKKFVELNVNTDMMKKMWDLWN